MTANNDYIIEILLSVGLIDHAFSEKALDKAERDHVSVIDVLDESGLVTRNDILKTMANQFGMEFVPNLSDFEIEQEVIDKLSPEVANRYKVVPIYEMDGVLKIAISDPLDVDTIDSLTYILKTNVEGVVAPGRDIADLITLHYGRVGEAGHMLEELTEASLDLGGPETQDLLEPDSTVSEEDAPIIKLVSLIIIEAFRSRASDIHIEPMEKHLRVRYRIDGVLVEVESPPKRLQAAIISRLKLMADMSIAEKRVPQDGRIQINVMGKDLDLRVSTVPSSHGESIVMRILDKDNLKMGLPQLGFLSDDKAIFDKLIHLADGIILVTGPTGSGKSTTLYACLNEINKPDRKIITVEEPVEYELSGINQVNVRADIGLTFAAALRSILRQAPNIIMIGEIRDLETAEIAVNASLTGHLVFSTLHTNDAPSAVTRLVDIGVKPFLVASSVRAIMAQRLTRCLCDKCKEPHEIDDSELRTLGPFRDQLKGTTVYRPVGCSHCNHKGYRGRKGLFEIFLINEEVQHMIFDMLPAAELRKKARELGMRTLREDGIRKVIAGITTIEEVMRVTVGDED